MIASKEHNYYGVGVLEGDFADYPIGKLVRYGDIYVKVVAHDTVGHRVICKIKNNKRDRLNLDLVKR